ncbi:MAG: arginine--tRNA ligase [Candidatus Paceibacterota bacterium]|jgi:arginyl-tRNA synthetase
MEEKIKNLIKEALEELSIEDVDFAVEHPENLKNGDYSTNVAMICWKKFETIKSKPSRMEVADVIGGKIQNKSKFFEIKASEPGFINFYLKKDFFQKSIFEIVNDENYGKNDILSGKKVMIEYTQPNPFKPFHIGHLMSNTIGESISRLVEFSGAKTVRANYQGDIGLHVGKAIWGLLQKGKPNESLSISEQAKYIGECYSFASNEYETNEKIKEEIDAINIKVYEKSDEKINELYEWGRKITLDAFEIIYKTLGTKFDYYFFESEMAPIGEKIVKENTGKVFEESDGAIVFKAEKYDPKLHTRVFITKNGLPTYETKEIGLALTKYEKENPDISITVTATEQGEYMKVVRKAIENINQNIASRMKHITHGMMRFATGKMSSRKGNIITGESLILNIKNLILEKIKERDFTESEKTMISEVVGVGALKYSILKQSIGADIIYDFEKSISFEGDSGPYIQYSYARAKSILKKANEENIFTNSINYENIKAKYGEEGLPKDVTEIEKMLYLFPEVVKRTVEEFEPHHIVTYLIEISRAFNTFYGNTQILNKEDPTSEYKIALTNAFSVILKNGLWLLGIKIVEKM